MKNKVKVVSFNSNMASFLLSPEQKRLKRAKVLRNSTAISEEDKTRYMPLMTNEYMSSEESLSESEDENGRDSDKSSDVEEARVRVLCIRPIPWRSRELNDMTGRTETCKDVMWFVETCVDEAELVGGDM